MIKRQLTIDALNKIIKGETDGIYVQRLLRFIEVENSREIPETPETQAEAEMILAKSFAMGIYF
jgi:hypothetical protein